MAPADRVAPAAASADLHRVDLAEADRVASVVLRREVLVGRADSVDRADLEVSEDKAVPVDRAA